jgi:SH3-like domain-containing protein
MIRQFAEQILLIIKPHVRSYEESLSASNGVTLVITPKESEWPGWLWCTTPDGRSGWVPQAFVKQEDNRAILLRDYDAVELTVSPGEMITVLERVAGWAWCRNAKGELGWVPNDCISG